MSVYIYHHLLFLVTSIFLPSSTAILHFLLGAAVYLGLEKTVCCINIDICENTVYSVNKATHLFGRKKSLFKFGRVLVKCWRQIEREFIAIGLPGSSKSNWSLILPRVNLNRPSFCFWMKMNGEASGGKPLQSRECVTLNFSGSSQALTACRI